jgi:shikimate dehydrogenase
MSRPNPNVGIVGTHVEGSLSPIMHNAAYAEMGLDLHYGRFQLPEDLGSNRDRAAFVHQFLSDQALAGVVGMSVTMPFKLIMLWDGLVDVEHGPKQVREIGAINTLSHPFEGIWRPDNTDHLGAVRSIEEAGVDIAGKAALVLGAGGTARATAYGLAESGAKYVTIANRTADKAHDLAAELAEYFPNTTFYTPPHLYEVVGERGRMRELLLDADIIYNTTNVGQSGTDGENLTPFELHRIPKLKSGAIINDAVYMPLETPLLAAARERSDLIVIEGTRMLLHQAVEQVKIFTRETDIPVEAMDIALQAEIVKRAP